MSLFESAGKRWDAAPRCSISLAPIDRCISPLPALELWAAYNARIPNPAHPPIPADTFCHETSSSDRDNHSAQPCDLERAQGNRASNSDETLTFPLLRIRGASCRSPTSRATCRTYLLVGGLYPALILPLPGSDFSASRRGADRPDDDHGAATVVQTARP